MRSLARRLGALMNNYTVRGGGPAVLWIGLPVGQCRVPAYVLP